MNTDLEWQYCPDANSHQGEPKYLNTDMSLLRQHVATNTIKHSRTSPQHTPNLFQKLRSAASVCFAQLKQPLKKLFAKQKHLTKELLRYKKKNTQPFRLR